MGMRSVVVPKAMSASHGIDKNRSFLECRSPCNGQRVLVITLLALIDKTGFYFTYNSIYPQELENKLQVTLQTEPDLGPVLC